MCDPGEPEPIPFEFTDELDLHSFSPAEVGALVRDFLEAARNRGLHSLRIIHGRGTGTQRRTVRTILERDPRVASFGDAPAQAGGWGATIVTMKPSSTSGSSG